MGLMQQHRTVQRMAGHLEAPTAFHVSKTPPQCAWSPDHSPPASDLETNGRQKKQITGLKVRIFKGYVSFACAMFASISFMADMPPAFRSRQAAKA